MSLKLVNQMGLLEWLQKHFHLCLKSQTRVKQFTENMVESGGSSIYFF